MGQGTTGSQQTSEIVTDSFDYGVEDDYGSEDGDLIEAASEMLKDIESQSMGSRYGDPVKSLEKVPGFADIMGKSKSTSKVP